MSAALAPPDPDGVHVWQVGLDVEGDELKALTGVLSADERERASRFVRPRDAWRSAAARGHLRRLLGRYLDCPAAEVAFGTGPYGKPYLSAPGAAWLRFNLSHSSDRGLIAVANGREVGVDLERIQPELADPALAKLFSPAEQRALAGLDAEDYVRRCFTLWTRKEAVVKAFGVGLFVSLDGVDVLDDRVRLTVDLTRSLAPASTSTWNVRSLTQVEGYSAAVAVQAPSACTSADHLVHGRSHTDDLCMKVERPVFDGVRGVPRTGSAPERRSLMRAGCWARRRPPRAISGAVPLFSESEGRPCGPFPTRAVHVQEASRSSAAHGRIGQHKEGRMFRLVTKVSGSVLVATVATVAAASMASAAPAQGTVLVVHGLRGIVADVGVDGAVVMRGFTPSRVSDELPLPAGPHTITIQRSGAAAGSTPLVTQRVNVPADTQTALVAGLSDTGSPVLTAYSDKPGSFADAAAIVIRDAAFAPAARPVLDSRAVTSAIAASHEVIIPTQPGDHTLALTAAQGGAPLLSSQTVPVTPGTATVLYLTGSSQNSTLSWLAQPVKLTSTQMQPQTVKTGNSGLAAEQPSLSARATSDSALLGWLGALALAGASWSGLRSRSRRRASSVCD